MVYFYAKDVLNNILKWLATDNQDVISKMCLLRTGMITSLEALLSEEITTFTLYSKNMISLGSSNNISTSTMLLYGIEKDICGSWMEVTVKNTQFQNQQKICKKKLIVPKFKYKN